METTLGGDRLGSGNRQKVSMKTYERSTHDLSYIWRSTMASGTLVPFLNEVGLPGDTFDINLDVNVMTHPTIGPLFGSFKIQLDVFSIPMRLYNGKLHMNKLGIGMDMSKIKIPQMEITANTHKKTALDDNSQINPSSIFSYLNIRGIGINQNATNLKEINKRAFNAIPYLAYWDIYKNYYANKQEEIGVMVHNQLAEGINGIVEADLWNNDVWIELVTGTPQAIQIGYEPQSVLKLVMQNKENEPDPNFIKIQIGTIIYTIPQIFNVTGWNSETGILEAWEINSNFWNTNENWNLQVYNGEVINPINQGISLVKFPLENIDTMRENILKDVSNPNAFIINHTTIAPYGLPFQKGDVEIPNNPDLLPYSKLSSQEGLAIKTYQSDLFNNWISTEWIDGTNGINEITSIDTTGGSFNIDTLNLSNKVYNMLNRIAISGGTYDDWLDAVYTHERVKSVENPIYMGSLIRELGFEEVVSLAQNEMDGVAQPLGTLAGKGTLTGKKKGGEIRIKIDEPSYIMGIISLTPKLDYSQGNKWDVNLETFNDFHKPALDEIGFQDLITDQMAWFDTDIAQGGIKTFKSAGKQPAWINYMTNVNQTRGNFAVEGNQMWMTLNRKYENNEGGIKDLTTYIDPTKFNHIFSDTTLDAQNFWTQVSCGITARRKMSAKIIPNL